MTSSRVSPIPSPHPPVIAEIIHCRSLPTTSMEWNHASNTTPYSFNHGRRHVDTSVHRSLCNDRFVIGFWSTISFIVGLIIGSTIK